MINIYNERKYIKMYLKRATDEDFDIYYAMKCDQNNMYWTGSAEIPKKENIEKFYNRCMKSKEEVGGGKLIYLIINDEEAIGYIYIDPSLDDRLTCDVPIGINSNYCGKGFGKKSILLGLDKAREIGYKKLVGKIREDNISSMKLYSKCGVTISKDYIMQYIESEKKEIKMWKVFMDL